MCVSDKSLRIPPDVKDMSYVIRDLFEYYPHAHLYCNCRYKQSKKHMQIKLGTIAVHCLVISSNIITLHKIIVLYEN